jgi:hypothetical protein
MDRPGEGDAEPLAPNIGRRRSLGERLRGEEAYGLLLLMIIASLVMIAAADRTAFGRALAMAMQGGVLLFALWTARIDRRLLRSALLLVPVVVVAAAILARGPSDIATGFVASTSAVLSAASVAAITRRVTTHPRVDGRTIMGALAIYLIMGTFFASVFLAVGAFSGAPFFAQPIDAHAVDYLYFSFVTLTTTGYGDLSARSDLARMLAVTEALIGQLYLVSVVALVIGNIGRERPRAR